MTARHCALIVEDNEEFSLGLQQILKSLDCDCIPVTNVEDAVRALETQPICLVLLDLEIKSEPDAIKGHVEHGKSLLRKIRQLHSEHSGVRFWLPVVVVSGFARERDVLLELMKDGASDVIEKPETKTISGAIRNAFLESGRDTHHQCGTHRDVSRDDFSKRVVVSIPGNRVKRRTTIRLGPRPVALPDNLLGILLHLVLGQLEHRHVNKTELGSNQEQGFKGISNLRNELKPVLGEIDIIENHYNGDYSFVSSVTIGEIAFDKLLDLGDHRISSLVGKLQQVFPTSNEKV
jgi:CheY-like chemotaxis protein